jgi:hypothetical protein
MRHFLAKIKFVREPFNGRDLFLALANIHSEESLSFKKFIGREMC